MIMNVDIMDDWKQFIIKNWICPPDKGMQFTRQKKETVGAPETQGKNQLEVELLSGADNKTFWFFQKGKRGFITILRKVEKESKN